MFNLHHCNQPCLLLSATDVTIDDIPSVNVTIIFDLINYPYSVNLDNLTSPNAQNLTKEANDEVCDISIWIKR